MRNRGSRQKGSVKKQKTRGPENEKKAGPIFDSEDTPYPKNIKMNKRVRDATINVKKAIFYVVKDQHGILKNNPSMMGACCKKCDNGIVREWILTHDDVEVMLLCNFLKKYNVMQTFSPYFSNIDYIDFAFIHHLFHCAPPEMEFITEKQLDWYRNNVCFRSDFKYADIVQITSGRDVCYMVGDSFMLFCISSQLYCCFPRSDCKNWNSIVNTLLSDIQGRDCLCVFLKSYDMKAIRCAFFSHVQFVEFTTQDENKTAVDCMKTIVRLYSTVDLLYKSTDLNLNNKQKLCYKLDEVLDQMFSICRL